MITRLMIWVTSDCSLNCKWCSQRYTRKRFEGYQMSLDEVEYIVNNCQRRGLYFDVIEITGGEPSLWENLEYGVRRFGYICDSVTLVTNGNNPERIKALGLKEWVVSASQATQEQIEAYRDTPAIYNTHQHRQPPTEPLDDVLPADCCVALTPNGAYPQNLIMYLRGKVYYCCNAFALSEFAGEETGTVCDFEDDFMVLFSDKTYDKQICRYCICNHNVWNRI